MIYVDFTDGEDRDQAVQYLQYLSLFLWTRLDLCVVESHNYRHSRQLPRNESKILLCKIIEPYYCMQFYKRRNPIGLDDGCSLTMNLWLCSLIRWYYVSRAMFVDGSKFREKFLRRVIQETFL